MSNVPESSEWIEGIYQLEQSDPVLGGPGGIANRQAEQLASRTHFLKESIEQSGATLQEHIEALDPHQQYMTQTEGDNRYSADEHTHGNATTAAAGMMSAADKSKLDGMAVGAAAVGNTAGAALASAGAPGAAASAARSDHVHPLPSASAVGAVPSNEKGAANGVATLGSDGKLPANQLPALSISDVFVVTSQAAMLALTAQRGDTCVRTDQNKTYILKTDDPTQLANWQEMLSPTGGGGSISSVGLAVPTGLTVSGSPITSSGVITITLAAGYSIPTTAKQSQWDTAYGWGNHASAGYYSSGGALGTPSSGNVGSCTVDGTNQVGYRNIPQNSQSSSYTCVLSDAGKHIYQNGAGGAVSLPSNASVAYPIGTAITIVAGANSINIGINSDTLRLAGAGTTGSRSLAAYGMATAVKVAATEWRISGTGLS